jgi:hypothetical protein
LEWSAVHHRYTLLVATDRWRSEGKHELSNHAATRRKYAVHGLAVDLVSEVPLVQQEAEAWLWPFVADVLPEGISCTSGQVLAFDAADVMRHVSSTAVPMSTPGQLLELYQEGERFWLVDDRWGLCEINVMKGTWRSWILPHPTLDPVRVAEMAVLWPMAQLLRPKGLCLIPAASVARGGFAAMILSPFNLEGELRALIQAGYNVIGQRWTAVREDGGRIELLQMPGQIERETSPRLHDPTLGPASRWVDLASEYCGVVRPHAFCDAVLVVEPGRRPQAHVTEIAAQRATDAIRRAWPITELHPFRKHGQLPAKLSADCRCWQGQFSRRPEDLLVLLDSMRGPVCTTTVKLPTSAALSAPGTTGLRLAM